MLMVFLGILEWGKVFMDTKMEVGPNCKVYLVAPETAEEIADDVLEYIERSLAKGDEDVSAEEIFQMALAGKAQLWGLIVDGTMKGIAITQIQERRNGNALMVVATTAEDFCDIISELYRTLEAFARQNNCVEIRSASRVGMGKLLRDFGFRTTMLVLSKALV